jgi:hypothetical protein
VPEPEPAACSNFPCCGNSPVSATSSCRLLSRSDIFKPLFKEDYEDFLEKEREAMATGQGVQATW